MWCVSLTFLHQNFVCTSFHSNTWHTPRLSRVSWFIDAGNNWWEFQSMKLFLIKSPSLLCYLLSLTLICLLQHLILEHSQFLYLLKFERLRFTPTPKRQNCSCIHLNFLYFRYQPGRQKIMYQVVSGISWVQSALRFSVNSIFLCCVVSKYLNCETLLKDLVLPTFCILVLDSVYETWIHT
jgi:hypothetical protein